jgi:sporulation-control protein
MVFKKLLAAMGAGGASVETTLDNPNVVPGGQVQGKVHLAGGEVPQEIEGVSVALVARVEVESGDSEHQQNLAFHHRPLSGRFELQPKAPVTLPFSLEIPWETPITVIGGQSLYGMAVGVGTEVSIARAVDKGDLDRVAVHPLPAQDRLLAAFANIGLRFKRADLERGRIRGSMQQLPFYQEIEFGPSPQLAAGMNELEVTFVAGPTAMEVIMEVDKRGGLFTEGHDTFHRFVVDYANFQQHNWEDYLHQQLAAMSRRHGIF